jgi:hypothetical protein
MAFNQQGVHHSNPKKSICLNFFDCESFTLLPLKPIKILMRGQVYDKKNDNVGAFIGNSVNAGDVLSYNPKQNGA